jgi:hypothetical protein
MGSISLKSITAAEFCPFFGVFIGVCFSNITSLIGSLTGRGLATSYSIFLGIILFSININ